MLGIFSHACWPSVYHLWRNIYSDLLPKYEFCGFKPTKFWGALKGNRKDCFSSEFWLKFCFLIVCLLHTLWWDFPVGSDCKESTCKAGGPDSIPGSGISPGEGNGYLPQYSCLGNPTTRGTWRATVHGVSKGWTRLSNQYISCGHSILAHQHLPA